MHASKTHPVCYTSYILHYYKCLHKLYFSTVCFTQPLISAGEVTLISNRLLCDAHCMFKDAETRTEVGHNDTLLLPSPPSLFSFWPDLSLYGWLPLKCCFTYTCTGYKHFFCTPHRPSGQIYPYMGCQVAANKKPWEKREEKSCTAFLV